MASDGSMAEAGRKWKMKSSLPVNAKQREAKESSSIGGVLEDCSGNSFKKSPHSRLCTEEC